MADLNHSAGSSGKARARPNRIKQGCSTEREEDLSYGWCPGEAAAAVPSPPGSPDFQFLDNPLQLWSQENELSPRAKQWQVLPPRPRLSPPQHSWEASDQTKRGNLSWTSFGQRTVSPPTVPSVPIPPPTPVTNITLPVTPGPDGKSTVQLRKVSEIRILTILVQYVLLDLADQTTTGAEAFRSVFKGLPYFNIVQSQVFDNVMYTDKSLVVCAPTGSGKTVVFELAIIRQLVQQGQGSVSFPHKIIYVSPIKALCAERWSDWNEKFSRYGLVCKELTGDTDFDDLHELQSAHVIITTPEKWDSMTRKWKDNVSLMERVRLFFIDEVHLLSDSTRGPTMEAVISRMKTIQSSVMQSNTSMIRFVAVSATIPNAEDVADWLSAPDLPTALHSLSEEHRPVRLRKVVLSFPSSKSSFKFDMSLNYKLCHIISTYAEDKPTLVFCSTRKGTQQAAGILVKETRFVLTSQHRQRLQHISHSFKDAKLREYVTSGVAFHHAGLDLSDRSSLESLFARGDLPVLIATSTLAMGVNLPAHLVVIKSTQQYVCGGFQEYSESQVVQMIGRAGRPQFDTTATAVIMTRHETRHKYEVLVTGTQLIESSLHHSMVEHINAEVVLSTITDINVALQWIKSTFLYIRIQKNPTHYGVPEDMPLEMVEKKLLDLCVEALKDLDAASLVCLTEDLVLNPTDLGRIMARYYISFDTMKRLKSIGGVDNLKDLVEYISGCKEFTDLRLRVTEKRVLNALNKDKNRETIRFPLNGRIKTTDMKVNCLIQATLGSLPIAEMSLSQDAQKIFRNGVRLMRCLVDCLMIDGSFKLLTSALVLAKCFKARLWENSRLIARQLDKIGITMATALAHAGMTTWMKLEEANPRVLELIVNRHPPFGSQVHDLVAALPRLELFCTQIGKVSDEDASVELLVKLANIDHLRSARGSISSYHCSVLVAGDGDNNVILKQRLPLSMLMKTGTWMRTVSFRRAVKSDDVHVHLINTEYVGLDVTKTQKLEFASPQRPDYHAFQTASTRENPWVAATPKRKQSVQAKKQAGNAIENDKSHTDMPSAEEPMFMDHMHGLRTHCENTPATPSAKRLRLPSRVSTDMLSNSSLSERYGYRPASSRQIIPRTQDCSAPERDFPAVLDDLTMSVNNDANHSHGRPPHTSRPEHSTFAYGDLQDDKVACLDSKLEKTSRNAFPYKSQQEAGGEDCREQASSDDDYLLEPSLTWELTHDTDLGQSTRQPPGSAYQSMHNATCGNSLYRNLYSKGSKPSGYSAAAVNAFSYRNGVNSQLQVDRYPAATPMRVTDRTKSGGARIPPHFSCSSITKTTDQHLDNMNMDSYQGEGFRRPHAGFAEVRPLVKKSNHYTLVRTAGNSAPVAVVSPRSRSPQQLPLGGSSPTSLSSITSALVTSKKSHCRPGTLQINRRTAGRISEPHMSSFTSNNAFLLDQKLSADCSNPSITPQDPLPGSKAKSLSSVSRFKFSKPPSSTASADGVVSVPLSQARSDAMLENCTPVSPSTASRYSAVAVDAAPGYCVPSSAALGSGMNTGSGRSTSSLPNENTTHNATIPQCEGNAAQLDRSQAKSPSMFYKSPPDTSGCGDVHDEKDDISSLDNVFDGLLWS